MTTLDGSQLEQSTLLQCQEGINKHCILLSLAMKQSEESGEKTLKSSDELHLIQTQNSHLYNAGHPQDNFTMSRNSSLLTASGLVDA